MQHIVMFSGGEGVERMSTVYLRRKIAPAAGGLAELTVEVIDYGTSRASGKRLVDIVLTEFLDDQDVGAVHISAEQVESLCRALRAAVPAVRAALTRSAADDLG